MICIVFLHYVLNDCTIGKYENGKTSEKMNFIKALFVLVLELLLKHFGFLEVYVSGGIRWQKKMERVVI